MRGEKNTAETVKRRPHGIRVAVIAALCAACIISLFFLIPRITKQASRFPAAAELDNLWKKADYAAVYDLSSRILAEEPFQNRALAYRGYAAFFLAMSQPEPQEAHAYIDTAVNSLRLALMRAAKRTKPQIEYMLGKTYFQKNLLSAYHYYADSAVRYLTEALASGYTANDIYEYLGLCYADLNMPEESIAAFTEALAFSDSDNLLLAIARQYYKSGQTEAAKPYLYRIKNTSTDEILVLTCARLLGDIYLSEGNIEDAQTEYETVLKKNPNDADSCYGLGLIYEKKGDMIRARAAWRKALKAQVNHAGALNKMDAKK